MAMKKLSLDLQCILSSSLQINTFKRVVEELVYNSLDAKATSIAVRIDIEENKIQVVDNGCGITENDFDLLGHKHSTSKCVDLNTLKSVPNTYGYRGQFLANLINIAQKVKITSRFEYSEDTWVKIFYNGKERDLTKTTTRPSVGTTVEVNGLFYNLHIQSKKVERLNELNEIKTLLKQLSLVHSGISISLRDDSKNEIVFKAHKNRSIYQTFGLLFNIDEKDIQEFKVEKKEYRVTAYFGKKERDITQYHWIFLNGKFINHSKLHKIVNENLSKSIKHHTKRKIKIKVDEDEDVITRENIPFYIILLSCPYYDYDISDSPKHTTLEFHNWQDITKLLKKLIMFYTGDETLNKQLKYETTTKTSVLEGDTRDQVRKIVEKLLKSNSKKIGISQIQNGVKGKLTKRKNKNNSLKLSLSKVIPSKNKIVRQNSKGVSKKVEINDETLPVLNSSEVISIKNEKNNHKKQIKEQRTPENKDKNMRKYSTEVKEIFKPKRTNLKKPIEKDILDTSLQILDMSVVKRKNQYSTKRNKNVFQNDYVAADIYSHNHEREKYEKQNYLNDSIEGVKLTKTKNKEIINSNVIRDNYIKKHNYNKHYKKEQLITENDTTTICNFTDKNKNITFHEKIEQIIVYDYVPHPLNSTECCDLYQKRLKKESHFSSRDLVKTILNTQHNICPTNKNIYLSHENDMSNLQQHQRSENIKGIFSPNPTSKHNRMKNIAKNTRDTTFDAWRLNIESDSPNNEHMFLSKMTYESHNYNNNINIQDNKKHKSLVRKTKQFITKQSKDNFLISIEKEKKDLQKNKLFKYKPNFKKHDSNSFGLKYFFINRNFLQESPFMIEFSNSTRRNMHHKTKCLNANKDDNFIFTKNNNWMKNSYSAEEIINENSVNSQHKNTYTINEDTSETRYNFNNSGQNYECIRYSNNVLQSTYTIETNSEKYLYNMSSNFNQEYVKNYTINKKDGFNFVFISEPQMGVIKSSSDKILEPINICETILSDNASNDRLNDSLANMGNNVNQLHNDIVELCTNRQELRNESLRVSLQEISHHFNNTTNANPNYIAVANKSEICNTGNNEEKENDDLNKPFTKDIDDDIHSKDVIEVPVQSLPHVDHTIKNYSIKNRPRFVPKGMSQIFENCNTKGVCDYNLDEEYYDCNIYKDFTNNVEINTEIFKPRIQNATENTTKAIEKVQTKLHKENSLLTFDGQLLKQAQVLGQVDGKFIAAVVMDNSDNFEFLVLFDQHAVHERIRLENNLADYFNEQEWKSVRLDDFLLKLSEDEVLYLHNYKEKFTQLGLEWNILSNCEVSVFGIPEAILGKNSRQVDRIITAVKSLILEEINAMKSQGGCISLHPKSIMDLVFSEACRYAIKFGDHLTIMDCRELIKSLSECKTPFQCAHGRPDMAVLMEMSRHDIQDYKADISKIRLFSVTKQKEEVPNVL